ncbi:Anamorsin like, partial [Dissostichus eleginoides]
ILRCGSTDIREIPPFKPKANIRVAASLCSDSSSGTCFQFCAETHQFIKRE